MNIWLIKKDGVRRLHMLILCIAGVSASWSQQTPTREAPQDISQDLDEITVVGVRSGPHLWKLSRGNHVMWVLGTLAPLPNEMTWRSHEAEAAIAESSEVLGPFDTTLAMQRDRSSQSQSSSLLSILPSRSYTRWLALKAVYIGSDAKTDDLSPVSAALLLQKSAYQKHGLSYTDQVWNTINEIAKSDHIAIKSLIVRAADINIAHEQQERRSADRGIEFLEATMSRIESDVRSAQGQANAWAVGDVATLKKLTKNDDCHTTLLANDWPFLSGKEARKALAQAQGQLVGEIDYAIRRYAASFAVIPICLLLQNHSLLLDLSANGVSVDEPFSAT